MSEKEYHWDSPFEWLADKAKSWDAAQLHETLITVAGACDSDTLQDIFQAEMNEDGYFEEIKP